MCIRTGVVIVMAADQSCRTVTDVGLGDNPAGMAVAAMSVISSGMQQIFCRTMQQKHKLSSHELLANTAPAQVYLTPFRSHKSKSKSTQQLHGLVCSPKTRNFGQAADVGLACCMQGWTLLLIGPFLDRYVSSSWVFDFNYTFPALVFLVLSCSMAVFVNISQFMCLGRFSAVSFQVAFPLLMELLHS